MGKSIKTFTLFITIALLTCAVGCQSECENGMCPVPAITVG